MGYIMKPFRMFIFDSLKSTTELSTSELIIKFSCHYDIIKLFLGEEYDLYRTFGCEEFDMGRLV